MKIVPMSAVLRKVDGTELDIVNAARVSFHKESDWDLERSDSPDEHGHYYEHVLQQKDIKLINYLANHGHWTPFGHVGATFVIKAPIFVARQLGKHQVGLVWNEVSRRYVDEEPEFWMPDTLRSRPEASMKQGSGTKTIPMITENGRHPYMELSHAVTTALQVYNTLLECGTAPEQARMILPQNMMTEWWWTGSLAAWARVFNLRLDPHTQQETRDLVARMHEFLLPHFPNALNALIKVTV